MTNYPSRRSVVAGFGGACATSQPLAAMAGLRMLMQGGNAADAAIAAAATLNVVEPMSTGMGGDAFALIYWAKDRKVYALNASGRAPYAATLDELQRRGYRTEMPIHGILPVTVPGAAMGWYDLLGRFGTMGLDTVLQPAIGYAEKGFPVSQLIAQGWQGSREMLLKDAGATQAFLNHNLAPRAGQRFANPYLGRSMRLLADAGPDAFYKGEIASAIVAASERYDGLLTMQDLADHTSTWVEPIRTCYRGHDVFEIPPNGQGMAALIALNILQGYDLADMGFESIDAIHSKMEAIKLGMTDAGRYVADPEMADVPVEGLLSAAYASQRRAEIDMDRAIANPEPGLPPTSPDTVYLCAADGQGNAVSFINSLYMGFGSGIVPEGTGVALQNRGNLFSLDADHPNCIAPHKRPYHTIIPCMVTKDDDLSLCFGVMGGFMQPQGHVQVITNILDHGMDPQQALDAPRFMYQQGNEFLIESFFSEGTHQALRQRGHTLLPRSGMVFGGGQVIQRDPESGAWLAGSEPRKDGCALAF